MVDKLESIHPELKEKALKILKAMEALGFPMIVQSGVRTTAEQQKLYSQGRTSPGNIVTNLDGVLKKSNHQIRDDGFSYAIDCVFLNKYNKPTWSLEYPWHLYGACAKSLGLIWGGDWKKLVDLPHIEIKK